MDHSSDNSTTTKPTKTKYPPGIVLGKDGKPCRVCTAFVDWTRREKKKQNTINDTKNNNSDNSEKTKKVVTTGSLGMAMINNFNNVNNVDNLDNVQDCPPDVEQLGRATWTFLHTMAAYYPEVPSYEQQHSMKSFLSSFSKFYPCESCAEHLRDEMKKKPPKVESRWALGRWLCQMHNLVNERLGKDIFNCDKIDERWKDGPPDGRCD